MPVYGVEAYLLNCLDSIHADIPADEARQVEVVAVDETEEALEQFTKGVAKFVLHFAFLAVGVAYVARRAERYYWLTLGALAAGLAVNAGYGVVQLLAARAGVNLDELVLAPLTGGASAINVYGGVEGEEERLLLIVVDDVEPAVVQRGRGGGAPAELPDVDVLAGELQHAGDHIRGEALVQDVGAARHGG